MQRLLTSLRRFFREVSSPPRVGVVSPAQLREALRQMLSDPQIRALLVKNVLLVLAAVAVCLGFVASVAAQSPPPLSIQPIPTGQRTAIGT